MLPPSEKAEAIAKRETRIVHLMRLLMFALLIVCTCLMAYFVHDYLRNAETESFEDDFTSEANKVLESIGSSVDLTLGAVDAMVVSMISYARDTNQNWPVSPRHKTRNVLFYCSVCLEFLTSFSFCGTSLNSLSQFPILLFAPRKRVG
jgi:hypothetical protein